MDDSGNDERRSQAPGPFVTFPLFENPDPDQRFTAAVTLAQFWVEANTFVDEVMP